MFRSLFVDLAVTVQSVVVLGDLNIDLSSKTSCEANYLRQLLNDTNSTQIINEPTRVTANSATLIDHIIVDKMAEIKRIGVIDAPSLKDQSRRNITDHKLIFCEV